MLHHSFHEKTPTPTSNDSTKEPLAAPPTLLHHGEVDLPGALEEGPVDFELELAGDVAGVDARVVESHVLHGDGHVLHVFAAIPLDPPTEAAWKFMD